MYYKFTARAEKALEEAQELAMDMGHDYIGSEHILYGLTAEGTGVASKVLEDQGVIPEGIKDEIDIIVGTGEPIEDPEKLGFTPRSKKIIENAFIEARKTGNEFIGTEHLLLGILREGDCVATRILIDLNASPQNIYSELM